MLFEKLLKVQNELKVSKNQKVKNKSGQVMYRYRSCEDILEAVKPLLEKHKLTLTLSDSIELVGERYYIKATITIIDIENNEMHSVSSYAQEPATKGALDSSQITGATSTYARKYGLNGLFCIDDTKDADFYSSSECNTENSNSKPQRQEQLVSDIQIAEIMKKCSEHKKDVKTILECYKISNLKELTVTNYIKLMERFKEV